MRIQIVCPARPGSLHGNRVTAERWARILRSLSHRVRITAKHDARPCDLLLALHARKSAAAVFAFRRARPKKPIIVALTGTDLYRDIRHSRLAQRALELATRLVALQPLARRELPWHLQSKLHIIHQSVAPTPRAKRPQETTRHPGKGTFEVCVVGHLRAVKDPFRAALASRLLPAESHIRIVHLGGAMSQAMAQRARAEQRHNPRYRWLGGLPRPAARRRLAASRLLVLSSLMEGGANVVSEAAVDRVPVLASRIPGSVGLLEPGYPGYFAVRDTQALARLLRRAETDARFYRRLRAAVARIAPLFRPARERAAWRRLLLDISRLS
jgi:putative glycosyltransferase (TIGR04348 family)